MGGKKNDLAGVGTVEQKGWDSCPRSDKGILSSAVP